MAKAKRKGPRGPSLEDKFLGILNNSNATKATIINTANTVKFSKQMTPGGQFLGIYIKYLFFTIGDRGNRNKNPQNITLDLSLIHI